MECSPKDAVLFSDKAEKLFQEGLDKIEEENFGGSTKENNYMIALYDTLTQAMCNQTGEDAVKLLISSHRIQGDVESYAMVITLILMQL